MGVRALPALYGSYAHGFIEVDEYENSNKLSEDSAERTSDGRYSK